ncbi:MAG: ABC transporter ATP-binding protein [Cyclobacteriaceae bacterium]|nr:ABC transporter ATP-binding protein [Cyclobacteriaceae bacterium]
MSKLSISVNNLSKRYNREWIFRNLNYTFEQGKIYAITGPNGSGKSTLLQVLWGQLPMSEGKLAYTLNGQSIETESMYKQVSIATPYMELIDEFTLYEQVVFHFKSRPVLNHHSPQEIIEIMYLEQAKNKYISNFSSGMKQRLKLGLAFLTDTPALFLDEPGTNLDRQAFDWFAQQMQKNCTNRLVCIASNQPEEYPNDAEIINLSDYKA